MTEVIKDIKGFEGRDNIVNGNTWSDNEANMDNQQPSLKNQEGSTTKEETSLVDDDIV